MQLIRIHVAWSRIIGIIEIKLVVLNRRHSSDDALFVQVLCCTRASYFRRSM